MSAALIAAALVVALVLVPSVAGMTGMALAGGDGEPRNAWFGGLGAIVAYGSIYTAITCFTAFWGLPDWRWWLTLLPLAAGLVGALSYPEEPGDVSGSDRLLGVALQLTLGFPAVLLLASGAVTL